MLRSYQNVNKSVTQDRVSMEPGKLKIESNIAQILNEI